VTATEAATGLVARTVPVDPAGVDLLTFAGDDGVLFERDGYGLAGRGVALRVAAADAAAALAAIDADDGLARPGTGPVAFGALPFRPDAAGEVVVPAVVVGRARDGTAWRTVVGTDAPPGAPAPVRRHPPDDFRLTAARPHDEWLDIIADAVAAIRAGRLRKVVLAREVTVEANRPVLPLDVMGRLRALYPSCMLFSVDGFVGASPELLVSRRGDAVRSQPMAGTIPRSGDPDVDARLAAALLASGKDRHEHAMVVDAVAATLRPHCSTLEVPDEPSIVPLRNVSHLGTVVSGRLDGAGAAPPSALALATLLHPTPAVGGTPTGDALAYIAEAEGLDRGRYAGPVGWMDARGDGEWAVGVRSAELDGSRARLFAGVGVVGDSVPELELAETQLKLQALLAAVVRP
jgi:menaquinone-specific isochorismate synthase